MTVEKSRLKRNDGGSGLIKVACFEFYFRKHITVIGTNDYFLLIFFSTVTFILFTVMTSTKC